MRTKCKNSESVSGSGVEQTPEKRVSKKEKSTVSNGKVMNGEGVSSAPEELGVSSLGSDVVMAEKTEEGAEALGGSKSLVEKVADPSGVDAPKRKKRRKSGQGESSTADKSDVKPQVTSKNAEGGVTLDGTAGGDHVDGGVAQKKSRKSGRVVSNTADESVASPRASDVVMSEKSEEAALPAAGDCKGADVVRKVKSRKSGKGGSSAPEESDASARASDILVSEKVEEAALPTAENYKGVDVVPKTKIRRSGKGGSSTHDQLDAPVQATDVVKAEKRVDGARLLDESMSHLPSAGDHMPADATQKRRRKSRKGGSSVLDQLDAPARATDAVMAEKTEVGALPLDRSAAHLATAGDHTPADATPKRKSRKSGKGESSVPNQLDAPPKATDVVMTEKTEEVDVPLNPSPAHTTISGDNTGENMAKQKKNRKTRKGVSSVPDQLDAPARATDVEMAEKTEESAAPLNQSVAHPMVGDNMGVDVTERKKSRRAGKGVSTMPVDLNAQLELVVALPVPLASKGASAEKMKPRKREQKVEHEHSGIQAGKSSLLDTSAISVNKNDNETSITDNLVLPSREEGLLGPDADLKVKGDLSSDVKLISGEVKKGKKSQKRKTGKDPNTDPMIVDNLVPSVEKDDTVVPRSNINAADTISEIKADSANGSGSHVQGKGLPMRKKKKKKKKNLFNLTLNNSEHNCGESSVTTSSLSAELAMEKNNGVASVTNDLNVTSANSSSTPATFGVELTREMNIEISQSDNLLSTCKKENGGLSSMASNKTGPTMEVSTPTNGSPMGKKRQRCQKKKSLKSITERDSATSSMIKKGATDTSDKIESVLPVGTGDGVLIQTADANSPKGSGRSPEMVLDSVWLEDASSSQAPMSDKNPNRYICPSPIRGVVNDYASADVPKRLSKQLDSLKIEEDSFSFPTERIQVFTEPTASHSEVAPLNSAPTVRSETTSDGMSARIGNEKADGRRVKMVASSAALSSSASTEKKDLEAVPMLVDQRLLSSTKKKLLVLDLNGILADVVTDPRVLRNVHVPKRVGGKAVFKRPFCDDFLKFCFEKFNVGIWSSRKLYNVNDVVDYLMPDTKHKLLFAWDQSRCTLTQHKTLDNPYKPLVLKELKKLWNKEESDLPWEKGEYMASNTLLVDDSPYKALGNPPYTAIFPTAYSFGNKSDNSLGPGGDLRVYLEEIAGADDVQEYVKEHPFGQDAITATHTDWNFYQKVIESVTIR